MTWTWIIRALLAIAFICFLIGVFGCTPNANFAAYGSALNGQFNRPYGYYEPAPYYAWPPPYQSQWMGPPRVTCTSLGQFVTCHQV